MKISNSFPVTDTVPRAVHEKALRVLSLLCPFHRCRHRRSSDVQETAWRLHSSEALVDPGFKPFLLNCKMERWQHLAHRLFVRTIQKNKRVDVSTWHTVHSKDFTEWLDDTGLMRSTATIYQQWGREAQSRRPSVSSLCVLWVSVSLSTSPATFSVGRK